MFKTRHFFAAGLTLALGTTLSAAPVTFELNDTGIGDGSITGVGTTTVTGIKTPTGAPATDALTLTLGATVTGGVTLDSINEGGGGGQSGLGINVTGGNSSNSGNEAQDVSTNTPPNPINETFTLSFKDDLGNDVAVEFISAEISRLSGAAESVIVQLDGTLIATILGTSSGGSDGGFSTAFTGSPVLAAGDVATFAPGANTSFRLRSVTVAEIIPEPASLVLAGAGLALIAGRRRRVA